MLCIGISEDVVSEKHKIINIINFYNYPKSFHL